MQNELLSDIGALKNIIRAKRGKSALDRLHLDLLGRAEKALRDGDERRAAELCAAVTSLDKQTLMIRERLAEIRGRYSENIGDGALDALLEKHFGRYVLSEPLNLLSEALTLLRAALLDGNGAEYAVRLRDVRDFAKLPEEYAQLSRLITEAAVRTEELIARGETEHAAALIDAVHALPEIVGAPERSRSGYERCFVRPYTKRFNDGFFNDFDLRLIIK